MPKSELKPGHVGAMLALCWLIFRSWALLGRILRFVLRFLSLLGVFLRFGPSRARFWRVSEGSGKVLEDQHAHFSMFFDARKLAMRTNSECAKTTVFPMVFMCFTNRQLF